MSVQVAPLSDDPLGKRIKKTLGEYDAIKDTISNNPKNLIGITRQPHTPLPSLAHHDAPLFPDLHKPPKPPYLNGQHKHGSDHNRSSSSRGSGRDVDGRNKALGNPEFVKPKAGAPVTSSSSSSSAPTTSSSTASAFHATSSGLPGPSSGSQEVGKTEPSKSLPSSIPPVVPLPPSAPSQPLASSRQPSPPVKEKSRDRSSCPPPPHHMPSAMSSTSSSASSSSSLSSSSSISSSSSSSKYQSSSSVSSAMAAVPSENRPNGVVFNGNVKSGHSRPSGPKTNLRLQIDNQVTVAF